MLQGNRIELRPNDSEWSPAKRRRELLIGPGAANMDRGRLTRLRAAKHIDQLVGRRRLLAVQLDDHVADFDASDGRRSALADDVHAAALFVFIGRERQVAKIAEAVLR